MKIFIDYRGKFTVLVRRNRWTHRLGDVARIGTDTRWIRLI